MKKKVSTHTRLQEQSHAARDKKLRCKKGFSKPSIINVKEHSTTYIKTEMNDEV